MSSTRLFSRPERPDAQTGAKKSWLPSVLRLISGTTDPGQQQRVAIARALVNEAPLLFADEPTGNLDTKTSLEIMELLSRLNREAGITLVLVTHELDIAAFSKRLIRFVDGLVVSDIRQGDG